MPISPTLPLATAPLSEAIWDRTGVPDPERPTTAPSPVVPGNGQFLDTPVHPCYAVDNSTELWSSREYHMTIKSNPADAVNRWRAGVGAAGQRYTQGVQNSADWASAATAPSAVNARNAGLQRAMANGSIERGIQNVGTNGWRAATVAKAGNWQTGVNSPLAQQRAQAGFNRLFGYLQNGESAVSNLPRGTFNDNMQRFTAYVTAVHNAAESDKGNL